MSKPSSRLRVAVFVSLALAWAAPAVSSGPSVSPLRSWTQLVTSNGYTGVVVDLSTGRVTHFREHIFATEEPRWRDDGAELWEPTVPGGDCWKPQAVASRDLLRDAYFGLSVGGTSLWLDGRPVDLDASGYDGTPDRPGRDGGTGVTRMVQRLDELGLVATTRVFAPIDAEWSAFVLALEVTNTTDAELGPIELYGLVNANVGYGRPGPRSETGADFETIRREADGAVIEQGFAGTVVVRPLDGAIRSTHTPAAFYEAVRDGLGALPEPAAGPASGNGLASAYEWHLDALAPGASAWVGLVVSHDPNPDYDEGRLAATDAWIAGRGSQALWDDERAGWAAFQARVHVPDGLTDAEQDLYHHSATVLKMAQVRESSYWVRPEVDRGVARRTGVDHDNVAVGAPGMIREHEGAGAVLASLPPGEWAYAWVRDGAYAIVGLTDAGLYEEARAALAFYLQAHANRYIDYGELTDVPLRDYALSLTRYHGFGIEESDTTCNGDLNFEWDGFGLFLWALRHYTELSGDTTLVDEHWATITGGVGDVIVGLVDDTGLMWPDSSIWEVHWYGNEKRFTYTNVAAARGLCDLGALAAARGETAAAARYRDAGRALRREIYRQLRNPDGALAANVEELATGTGYWDAAAIEGVAMGLFDPTGPTSSATLRAIRDNLTVATGCGIFRNDDQFDAHGLSPYGGIYDSLEWIFLDYRTSIAARQAGDDAYADGLQQWVFDQTQRNYLLIAENYDAGTGEYRNNAPMIGFGAGSYITAMRQREGDLTLEPACGFYFEDDPAYGPGTGAEDGGGGLADDVPRDVGVDTWEEVDTADDWDWELHDQDDLWPPDDVSDADAPAQDTDAAADAPVADAADATAEDGSGGADEDSGPADAPDSATGDVRRPDGGDSRRVTGGGCAAAGGGGGGEPVGATGSALLVLGFVAGRRRRPTRYLLRPPPASGSAARSPAPSRRADRAR